MYKIKKITMKTQTLLKKNFTLKARPNTSCALNVHQKDVSIHFA